jgi:hypothetical protein
MRQVISLRCHAIQRDVLCNVAVILLILSVSLLSSCLGIVDTVQGMKMGLFFAGTIPVDDFQIYWNKSGRDPTLVGTWRNLDTPYKGTGPDQWRFIDDTSQYQLQSWITEYGIYETIPTKTLVVGRYNYLLISENGQPGGHICRYTFVNRVLTIYTLNDKPALSWLRKKYPLTTNIGADNFGKYDPGVVKMIFIHVKSFDQTVFQILSDIPDSEDYWSVASRYQQE